MKEFRPAFLFLGKFIVIYFVGNILYGLYIESYGSVADGITTFVSFNSIFLLNVFGEPVLGIINTYAPTILMKSGNLVVLSIYEGCNGVNVMIVFLAFIIAFGGRLRNMIWFIPTGLLIIHIFNLVRIILLYYTSTAMPEYYYFVHKYLFTAFLYLIVFGLWVLWVGKFNDRKSFKN